MYGRGSTTVTCASPGPNFFSKPHAAWKPAQPPPTIKISRTVSSVSLECTSRDSTEPLLVTPSRRGVRATLHRPGRRVGTGCNGDGARLHDLLRQHDGSASRTAS